MIRPLRILGLASYPEQAASTRYRLLQYVSLLHEYGIELEFRSFLSEEAFAGLYDRNRMVSTASGIFAGSLRRVRDVLGLGGYDAVFVQREAALVGPPLVEWFAARRLPLVVDLDDATYLPRPSAVYGSWSSVLKGKGKANRLIDWADHVVCGNKSLARYVGARGVPVTVVPTVVDVERFVPAGLQLASDRGGSELVIGWIGTPSTFPDFQLVLPVLQRLAAQHRFRVRIIGSGVNLAIDALRTEFLAWALEREVSDFQTFDIAVYPLRDEEWNRGKSGLKAIQYLSCGIPYVASPIGLVAEVGCAGETHFEARNADEWFARLSQLICDPELRARMSRKGREYAIEHFSTIRAAQSLAEVFRTVTATGLQTTVSG